MVNIGLVINVLSRGTIDEYDSMYIHVKKNAIYF